MAYDFQQFSLTLPGTNRTPTVPEVNINLLVTDSETGATIRDFTGANAFSLWTAFSSLSNADKKELLEILALGVIRKKAGL